VGVKKRQCDFKVHHEGKVVCGCRGEEWRDVRVKTTPGQDGGRRTRRPPISPTTGRRVEEGESASRGKSGKRLFSKSMGWEGGEGSGDGGIVARGGSEIQNKGLPNLWRRGEEGIEREKKQPLMTVGYEKKYKEVKKKKKS